MAALSQISRTSSRDVASPAPAPAPEPSSSANPLPKTSNGVSELVADPATGGDDSDSASTSRSSSPRIPRTIVANGVTYDILRPEELDHEVPVFGERRRRAGATKPKKPLKRKCEEEDEAKWEAKRRKLIQEKVLKKEFIGYTEEDMTFTEDGLRLPEMPEWLNVTREHQDNGSLGIFIARPSKKDIKTRWPEIIQALEPIGVEIGAVKIIFPREYLDDPLSVEELGQYMRRSTSPFQPDHHLPAELIPPTPAPLPVLINGSGTTTLRSPHLDERADLIPPPQLDKNGIPKIWIVDQRLPLHTKSASNLAPIYCVSSTNKRQITSSQLLTDITAYKARQLRIASGDPSKEAFSPLTESTMLLRGRTWSHISNGDKGGISIYSSDNDADPYTRAYIGVGNPHLTDLPGNVMFDSKSKIVGIHTPFFYFGRAHTLFALHAEDYNAMSLNYHHFGADKIWRVVSPHYYHVVEDFVASHLPSKKGRKQNEKKCSQFVRHASIYLPGPTLEIAGARSIQFRQRPGELVITWPLAYHEGYNEGLNINEACGYGHKNWRRVFATGEEEKGEEAIYRPCGENCMGGVNPIILDFEPERGSNGEVAGGGAMADDEVEKVLVAKVVGRGRGRKRSRPVGDEANGVQVKRLRSPVKKVKVLEGERSVAGGVESHVVAIEGPVRKKLRVAEEVEQNDQAMQDGPPLKVVKGTVGRGRTAENGTSSRRAESERIDDIDGYHAKDTKMEILEIEKYDFHNEKAFDARRDVSDMEMGDEKSYDDATEVEDDESEVDGVDLVPVQPDVEHDGL